MLITAGTGHAYWANTSYPYRINITLTGASPALSNYQTYIEINSTTATNHTHFFSYANETNIMIRYYNSTSGNDTTELKYWIKEWNATSEKARIWINVTYINTSGTNRIHIYYGINGSGSGTNNSNYSAVFLNSATQIWNKTIDMGGYDYTLSATQDESNLYISGPINRTAQHWQYLQKMTKTDGTLVCQNWTYPSGYTEGEGMQEMKIASDGTIIGATRTGPGSCDAAAFIYDTSTCKVIYQQSFNFGGGCIDSGAGILQNGTDIFLSGQAYPGAYSAFLAKMDATLTKTWNITMPAGSSDDTIAQAIMKSDLSATILIYPTSYTYMNISWIDSSGAATNNFTAGFTDFFRAYRAEKTTDGNITVPLWRKTGSDSSFGVAKINESGANIWNKTISVDTSEYALGVDVDEYNGFIFVSGELGDNMTMVKYTNDGTYLYNITLPEQSGTSDRWDEVISDAPYIYLAGTINEGGAANMSMSAYREGQKATTEPTKTISSTEVGESTSPPTISNEAVNSTLANKGDTVEISATITGINVTAANFSIMTPDLSTVKIAAWNTTADHWIANCTEGGTCDTNDTGEFILLTTEAVTAGGAYGSSTATGIGFNVSSCTSITFLNITSGPNNTDAIVIYSNESAYNHTNVTEILLCSDTVPDGLTRIIFNDKTQIYEYIAGEATITETLYLDEPTNYLVIATKELIGEAIIPDALVQVEKFNGTEFVKTGQKYTDGNGEMMINCSETDTLKLSASKEDYDNATDIINVMVHYINGYTIKMDYTEDWYIDNVTVHTGNIHLTRIPAYMNVTAYTYKKKTVCFSRYILDALVESTCQYGNKFTYPFAITNTNRVNVVVTLTTPAGWTAANITYTVNLSEASGFNVTSDLFMDGVDEDTKEMTYMGIMIIAIIGLSAVTKKPRESAIAGMIMFSFVSTTAQVLMVLAAIIWIFGTAKEYMK